MVRVRFAPSPTGFLHIGGVRTALFNFLFARNRKGKFLLRLEDTDRERSLKQFEEDILSSLTWLELHWDEEVIHQSRRLDRYRDIAAKLMAQGVAYEENLEGKIAIKFKMPARSAFFHDLVHGPVQFDASLFEDLVIVKSDGYPTYHLACVVDDHDMEISHVIRGDDHLSNTPRQILLFEALGWTPPEYAHLPLIFGSDGTPLSKRHGAVALKSYREEGFLPEAILNYLALLGWGPKGNQEFFRMDDLIEQFSLKRVTKSNARFNRDKLEWLNTEHLNQLSESDYLVRITAFFEFESKRFPPETWKRLVLLYRKRIKTFQDLMTEAAYCFSEIGDYGQTVVGQFHQRPSLKGDLEAWLEAADRLPDFDDFEKLEKITREISKTRGMEARDLIHPLRFALTGKTVSPGLFELMSVLGKETCIKRVRKFIEGDIRKPVTSDQ
jgi:glutamyl-tRNA synthetase